MIVLFFLSSLFTVAFPQIPTRGQTYNLPREQFKKIREINIVDEECSLTIWENSPFFLIYKKYCTICCQSIGCVDYESTAKNLDNLEQTAVNDMKSKIEDRLAQQEKRIFPQKKRELLVVQENIDDFSHKSFDIVEIKQGVQVETKPTNTNTAIDQIHSTVSYDEAIFRIVIPMLSLFLFVMVKHCCLNRKEGSIDVFICHAGVKNKKGIVADIHTFFTTKGYRCEFDVTVARGTDILQLPKIAAESKVLLVVLDSEFFDFQRSTFPIGDGFQ